MILKSITGRSVELVALRSRVDPTADGLTFRLDENEPSLVRVTLAARTFLGMGRSGGTGFVAATLEGPPPAVFREQESGLLRMVYREIVVRFLAGTSKTRREAILKDKGLSLRTQNRLISDQVIVYDATGERSGAEIVDLANEIQAYEEVVFSTPNFVSEYRRTATPRIPAAQWHLKNLAKLGGQVKGEDLNVAGAWKLTRGDKAVVVAVLDDGVDVEHPNLKPNILRNPDPCEKRDTCGRDFFVPDDEDPEHFDPRPKNFQYPFYQMSGNDIHGTPCAGLVAAAGTGVQAALGVAPLCRILPVKVFHADNLASDARVADAIRYAALHADVISCSWAGPVSDDIAMAIKDAGTLNRKGKGTLVVCAAGNDRGRPVGFPASLPEAIAVGASTDQGLKAGYSNVGPELSVVAPSSGGVADVYTTDVSLKNRGFNLGTVKDGGKDGLHTNAFGGTSAATPMVAGVAALMLSVCPTLSHTRVKQILCDTADKIGTGYNNTTGQSPTFGYGRVNAAKAVAEAIATCQSPSPTAKTKRPATGKKTTPGKSATKAPKKATPKQPR
jgi:subtilisin family serine protease